MKPMKAHQSSPNKLYTMVGLHFLLMYILMFAMVDRLNNVLPNLNQFYMAGIMTTPMLILEIIFMGEMYPDKKLLTKLALGSTLIFLLLYFFIRNQTGITDKQFLKSMIPHHGGAILMCENAPINDPEIKELCDQIIVSQQKEINQMKQILNRLN